MKRRIISLILPLIFILTGLIVGVVPVVIPLAFQAENNGIIAEYSEKVSHLTEEEREDVAHEMKTYNNGGRSNFYTALDNETVISYIDIPKINVYLPVYKGTDDATLDRGIGIMENTSLPIGGMGSHCVLSGHSGLTLRTMFNSLDQLEVGDCFYLHTYQYRYKKESWNAYHYGETITPGYISWIYDATYSDKCIYEARAVLQTKNNGTAYSAWASFKLPY